MVVFITHSVYVELNFNNVCNVCIFTNPGKRIDLDWMDFWTGKSTATKFLFENKIEYQFASQEDSEIMVFIPLLRKSPWVFSRTAVYSRRPTTYLMAAVVKVLPRSDLVFSEQGVVWKTSSVSKACSDSFLRSHEPEVDRYRTIHHMIVARHWEEYVSFFFIMEVQFQRVKFETFWSKVGVVGFFTSSVNIRTLTVLRHFFCWHQFFLLV